VALNAIYEVCLYCKLQFSDKEIAPLYLFLQQNYQILKTEHSAKLVEAAGIIASVLEDEKLKVAVREISKIPLMLLQSQNRQDVIKGVSMLVGLVKSIDDLPFISLKDSLGPLFAQTWPVI